MQRLGTLLVAASLWLLTLGTAWAQQADGAALQLPEPERQRLREVLDKPVDPNALLAGRIEQYKLKDAAAWRLGDMVVQEQVLRDWAAIDPNARWRLRDFLSFTDKRAEAYAIGHELIREIRYAPAAVRIRTTVANNYIDDSNLKKAGDLLDEAENLIKTEWGRVNRGGQGLYWMVRAEMEYSLVRSYHLRRSGKWQEGLQTAKLAVDKGKQLMGLSGLVDERERNFGRSWYVSSMATLADHQSASGLYVDADMTLREAYRFAKSQGFTDNQLQRVFNAFAWLRNATGQFEEGLAYSQRVEGIVLAQGLPKGAPSWLFTQIPGLQALAGMGRWTEAIERFADIDRETGKLKTRSSLSNQPHMRALVLLNNGRPQEALRAMQGTMNWHLTNFGEDHYFTAFTRGLYAAALFRSGQTEAARQAFEKAVQNMTAPEALTGDFAENAYTRKVKKFIFQTYIDLLAQTAGQNAADAAQVFRLADHLNASSVQQALADAAVRSAVNVPGLSDVIRQEQEAKNEMAALQSYMMGQGAEGEGRRNPQVMEQMRARLKELELLRKGYKARIQKGFPEYFQLIQPKAPSHTDIAQQLRPDELFVSVLPMEQGSYVWAIDAKGQVQFHRWALGEQQTQALVERVRKTLDVAGLGTRAPAFDVAGAHALYQGLLQPFEGLMADKKHLILATSGALAKLPLAVLVRQPPVAGAAPAWLIRDLAVSHVPTASGWLALKRFGKVPAQSQALIAWGDPLFDARAQQVASAGQTAVRSLIATRSSSGSRIEQEDKDAFLNYSKIPPLPETRDEVMELARILSANPKEDLILGAAATRASVLQHSASGKLARKQVVVFATHGLLAGDLPNLNQPALAMAATSNPAESPLLTLEDVLGLKLNADWVVLSACNTAGADGRAEEALSGLARGFFFAGSRSLLVTHWSVESESAMLLTTHTFDAYKKQPDMRRAEALRQAMLQTMQTPRFAHPAFWAPYALVGEGGR
ncbi:MAG: hypothetical protein RL559_1725 [Pseudomonadota bacterium]